MARRAKVKKALHKRKKASPDKWERMGEHIKESMSKSHPESKGWSEERKNAYQFGGKRKAGWVPRRERLKKAAAKRHKKK